MLGPAGSAMLRQALIEAHYTSDGLAAARSAGGPEPGSTLDTLVRVLSRGRTVPVDVLEAALAPLPLCHAIAAGLIEDWQGGVRAAVRIEMHEGWWLISDFPLHVRPGELPKDHVIGLGQAPAVLARAVVRDPVLSALDLCCGSGVQSLHLPDHAGTVTATDLSPRALTFAATTAALNELDWRLTRGDLTEPVAGQRFDLVVCNPPFVVGPERVDYLYRDSGQPGDELGAQLAAAAPGLLNEGGYMQYLAGWAHVAGQDWSERVAAWASGYGMDAWIVQLNVQDPVDYVRSWTADPGSAGNRGWLSWLLRQRIEAVASGLITLRNSGSADPVIRVDDVNVHQVLGSDVSSWFRRQDWLRDHNLLGWRFRAVDGLRLQSSAWLREGSWERDRYHVTTPTGPTRTDQVSDLIVSIITSCDGTLPLAGQLARLAGQVGADPAELETAAIPAVRELVEHNIIEPVRE
jgi:methylase of polypeptide subunit release factors